MADEYNSTLANSGKFRAKQWAEYHSKWYGGKMVENWPDIIESSKGKKPRPEGSRARAVQPDDRYDALGCMEWMRSEFWAGLDNN